MKFLLDFNQLESHRNLSHGGQGEKRNRLWQNGTKLKEILNGLELVFPDGLLEDVPKCAKLFFKSEIVIA
jgi:hypothetical protein